MADINKKLTIEVAGQVFVMDSGGMRISFDQSDYIKIGKMSDEIVLEARIIQNLIDSLIEIRRRRDVALKDKKQSENNFKKYVLGEELNCK